MSPRVSHLDNEQCRQCTSFADYMKENKKRLVEEQDRRKGQGVCDAEGAVGSRRPDCPLDKDELGQKSWGLLHTIAAKYPKKPNDSDKQDIKTFFNVFAKLYPCSHCAEGLREDLKEHPIRTNNQDELSQWLCEIHNRVNLKIGKPAFDCSKVHERWRDGWKDGSCD
ncbi:FAD-linked sulfhydryl oxidase ALR-like isoform X1 [Atheta coriaria]|uniref:FAD-linked sulfhydryl oxidase ALR-like isoform X1 n=1 Tax=Dalotia coriaria TaxID=877792 RepID=UPI0031F399B0